MIVLYTVLLLALTAVEFLIDRRAARLARKYEKTAAGADKLIKPPLLRQGNANQPDVCQSAKRYYELGALIQKRDRLEAKYTAWQATADRVGRWVKALRDWKGKKLPYTFGVLDVSCLLYLVDYLGAGPYVNARNLVQQLLTLVGR